MFSASWSLHYRDWSIWKREIMSSDSQNFLLKYSLPVNISEIWMVGQIYSVFGIWLMACKSQVSALLYGHITCLHCAETQCQAWFRIFNSLPPYNRHHSTFPLWLSHNWFVRTKHFNQKLIYKFMWLNTKHIHFLRFNTLYEFVDVLMRLKGLYHNQMYCMCLKSENNYTGKWILLNSTQLQGVWLQRIEHE